MLDIFTKAADTVGIFGVIVLLIAYYLLSIDKLSSQTFKYQLANLFGALCILFSLMFNWNTASVMIEAAWVAISLIGIVRILRDNSSA